MEWQHFESKLLTASAYDGGKRILYLRFRSGEVYRYFEFPADRYLALLDAESRGRYFLGHIRNQFRYERLAKGLLNNNLYKTSITRYVLGGESPSQSGCHSGRC